MAGAIPPISGPSPTLSIAASTPAVSATPAATPAVAHLQYAGEGILQAGFTQVQASTPAVSAATAPPTYFQQYEATLVNSSASLIYSLFAPGAFTGNAYAESLPNPVLASSEPLTESFSPTGRGAKGIDITALAATLGGGVDRFA